MNPPNDHYQAMMDAIIRAQIVGMPMILVALDLEYVTDSTGADIATDKLSVYTAVSTTAEAKGLWSMAMEALGGDTGYEEIGADDEDEEEED